VGPAEIAAAPAVRVANVRPETRPVLAGSGGIAGTGRHAPSRFFERMLGFCGCRLQSAPFKTIEVPRADKSPKGQERFD
jgi:hypothetical protein